MARPSARKLDPQAERRVLEAIKAHERGWLITPTRGKAPFRKAWQQEPPPDLDTVKKWAAEGNVALRTGAGSNLFVIDDDSEDGAASRALNLPVTVTAITGSGKRHLYFRAPAVMPKNSVKTLAPNLDTRSEGGAIVAVGSIHPDTGKAYEWAPGHSPDEVPLAELPPELLARLAQVKEPKPTKKRVVIERGSPEFACAREFALETMRGRMEQVAAAPEGQRNTLLNTAAFVLGRIVGSGALERAEVFEALRGAAEGAGLPRGEVEATVRSGLDAGERDPRDLTELYKKARRARDDDPAQVAIPKTDKRKRPVITCDGGRLPEIVDESETYLLRDGGQQIYQRDTMLVRMTRVTSTQLAKAGGIERPMGALILTPLEPAYLVDRLTRAICFQKFDARLQEYKVIDCPERVATTLIARKGHWHAPVLRGVVEAPTLRADGSILQTAGYDKQTGLFFDSGGVVFRPVPENPTLDDAVLALGELLYIIKDFPFVTGEDRAVALAAFLTALIRRSLRSAPLTVFRAPKMASGKSLLADVTAMIATGRPVPAMPQGKDEEEDRKRLTAVLVEGEQVCSIDNIERPLASSSLCSILTQETWKDRMLGKTSMVTVPTCTTWLATGNNVVIVGDLTTRALVCDLDAKCEHPEEREFDLDLHAHVPAHRAELASAALTILRAYHVAGRPSQGLAPFGRFEGWSDWIRAALVWVGEADPCATRKRIEEVDPVRRMLQTVFAFWIDTIGYTAVTAAEAIQKAREAERNGHTELWEMLLEVTSSNDGEVNSLRLGNWLGKHVNRIEAGLRIERAGDRQGVVLWQVRRA